MIEEGGALSDDVLQLDLNISDTSTPWINWLAMVPRRRITPLDAWLESAVDELMAAGDRRRLSTTPTTEKFAALWATFRKHHEELEECWDYRRKRWLIWRACALKVIYDRGDFQDAVDRRQCHDKLVAALAWFWPGIKPDGYADGSEINFWRTKARDDGSRNILGEYVETVLSLMKAAQPGSNT